MKLLLPAQLNQLLTVKNRVWMAPLTRCRANNEGHVPTDLMAEYYRQRAKAGLIISEATVVSDRAYGYMHTPGIYSDAQIEGWQKVTQAVHEQGGKIFCQLWHVGRVSHPDFIDGRKPVAPSAINFHGKRNTYEGVKDTVEPHALSVAEIQEVVQDFRQAAQNATMAGFDGVEIHSSNGYLFHQFFSNSSNTRTDEYGGSIENRTRFFFDVLHAVMEVIALERVGIRFNPMMHNHLGIMVDEETQKVFDHMVTQLNTYPIAYLHLTRPAADAQFPHKIPDLIAHYRRMFDGFLVANGAYDQFSGENALAKGRADAIAYGKLYISNPNLPELFEKGVPLKEWDSSTFYTQSPEGYTDY